MPNEFVSEPHDFDPAHAAVRSADWALGRLQGQVDSINARVTHVETAIMSLDAKLDSIAAILAAQNGAWAIWRTIINAVVAGSGWAAVALMLVGHHR